MALLLLKATLYLLLCFNGGGRGAVFICCFFRFSCASDSFAKSDGTATDCCVKNVSFLCLSREFFMDHRRTLIFFFRDHMAPNMRETKT